MQFVMYILHWPQPIALVPHSLPPFQCFHLMSSECVFMSILTAVMGLMHPAICSLLSPAKLSRYARLGHRPFLASCSRQRSLLLHCTDCSPNVSSKTSSPPWQTHCEAVTIVFTPLFPGSFGANLTFLLSSKLLHLALIKGVAVKCLGLGCSLDQLPVLKSEKQPPTFLQHTLPPSNIKTFYPHNTLSHSSASLMPTGPQCLQSIYHKLSSTATPKSSCGTAKRHMPKT